MEDVNRTEEYRVVVAEKISTFVRIDIGWAREMEHYAFQRYQNPVAYLRALKRCVHHLRTRTPFDMSLLETLVAGNVEEVEEYQQPRQEEEEEGQGEDVEEQQEGEKEGVCVNTCIWCSTVQCGAVRCGAVRCNVVLCGVVRVVTPCPCFDLIRFKPIS